MKQKSKFKETRIGMIPEDWEVKELNEVASYITEKINLDEINTTNFISTENMLPEKRGITLSSSLPKVGKVTQFKQGDILFSNIRTYFKKLWLAKFSGGCSNDVLVIRRKSSMDYQYLYYYLSQDTFFTFTVLTSKGTKMPRGDKNSIMSYEINIPPISEQSTIAKIPSDLDSKIELNQQMNKALEEISRAIFKRWFIDFEFPNEEDNPYKSSGGEMVDSEIGEIPKGWKVGKFCDILKEIESGSRPKGGIDSDETEIPSIGAENIDGIANHDYSKEKYISREFFEKMKQGIIKNNDVLMYKDGAKIGRISFFDYDYPHKECTINEHVFILRSNDKVNQEFLYLWLDRPNMTQSIINLNSNAAQPGINQTQVKTLPILIPNKEVLCQFQSIIKKLFHKIFENAKQNQNLSQMRDSLLPKLMSGRIRVPVEVKYHD